jgi:hypothetical protein
MKTNKQRKQLLNKSLPVLFQNLTVVKSNESLITGEINNNAVINSRKNQYYKYIFSGITI